MKGKAANHPNGNRTMEEEAPPEEEVEEVEEATQHQEAHRVEEAPRAEEDQSPPGPTYPPTSDLFPVLKTRNRWENSPTSSMEIEPKQKRSSTNLTTTSY